MSNSIISAVQVFAVHLPIFSFRVGSQTLFSGPKEFIKYTNIGIHLFFLQPFAPSLQLQGTLVRQKDGKTGTQWQPLATKFH